MSPKDLPQLNVDSELLGRAFVGYMIQNYPMRWNNQRVVGWEDSYSKLVGRRLLNFFRSVEKNVGLEKNVKRAECYDVKGVGFTKSRYDGSPSKEELISDPFGLFLEVGRVLKNHDGNFEIIGDAVKSGLVEYIREENSVRENKPISPKFLPDRLYSSISAMK